MFGIGQWFKRMRSMRLARKLWNDGYPMVSTDTAQYASEHYAPIWAKWAETFCADLRITVSRLPAAWIVHKGFWLAVMQADLKRKEHVTPRRILMDVASMEGNLSIIEAFAEVFGTVEAWSEIEKSTLVHPRVIAWQARNGLPSKAHVRDLAHVNRLAPDYSGWDAQEFAKGGPVMLAWVLDWVKLPDTVIDKNDGYAMVHYIQGLLDAMEAETGERGTDGMTTLKRGHEYRKHRAWTQVSHLATPIIAGTALVMLRAIYARFGFDPKLMDAASGRWSEGDLEDPHVCAIVDYADDKTSALEGLSWLAYRNSAQPDGVRWPNSGARAF